MGLKILRLLAYLIDLIIAYLIPYLGLSLLAHALPFLKERLELMAMLIFLAYNLIATYSYQFRTVGKTLARIKIVNHRIYEQFDLSLMIRELAKLVLLFPGYVGLFALLIDIIFLFAFNTTFQDILGQTQVVIDRDMSHE